jgi:hypothetical protein
MAITPDVLQAFIDATYRNAGLPPETEKVILPKRYSVTFPTIAVGATVTQQIQIAANGDFFLTSIRFRASLAGAAQTVSTVPVPNVRCIITDSGSDEQWFNQAVDLSQIANTSGASAFIDEPFPRVISGRSTITVQLTSFEAANTPVIDFTLVGVLVKLFSRPVV